MEIQPLLDEAGLLRRDVPIERIPVGGVLFASAVDQLDDMFVAGANRGGGDLGQGGNVCRASRARAASVKSGGVPIEMYAAQSAWNW